MVQVRGATPVCAEDSGGAAPGGGSSTTPGRPRRQLSARLAWPLALPLAAVLGCNEVERMAAHPSLAPPTAMAVRTSAGAVIRQELMVAGERSLAGLALGLGTTADQLVKDNGLLPGETLRDGRTLVIWSRPEVLQAYVQRRETAARERAAAIEKARRERELAVARAAAERIQQRRAAKLAEREARRKAREVKRATRSRTVSQVD